VLLGAARSVRARIGSLLEAPEAAGVERAAAAAAAALGRDTFTEMMERGRRMSIADAVAYESGADEAGGR
jgi:hypothetical protein